MTQVSRTQYKTDTNTLYPDNTSGAISPADLRAQIDNIADSSPFMVTQKTSPPGVNDDAAGTGGNGEFGTGDVWIDETGNNSYVCVDSTATAAVWIQTGGDLIVTRTGVVAANQIGLWANTTEIQGDSSFTYTAGQMLIRANMPIIEWDDNNAAADNQRWYAWVDSGTFKLQAVNDAGLGGTSLVQFNRTGNLINSLELTQSGASRTSITQNAINFSLASSSISTTGLFDLNLGTNSLTRLTVTSAGVITVIGSGATETRLNVGSAGLTTGVASIKIGNDRTSNGDSRLDLVADGVTYTDYALRLIRNAGANGISQLVHRGTGVLNITTTDSADLSLQTSGFSRLTVSSAGNVGIGTITPTGAKLVIADTTPRIILNETTSNLNISHIEMDADTLRFKLDAAAAVAASKFEFSVDGAVAATLNSTVLALPGAYVRAIKQYNAQTGTTYTLALTDINARITMSNAGANTLTIPTNATIALPVGTEIRIIQIGSGATSIDATVGVTLNGVSGGIGAMSGAGQYTDIIKVATDTWWAVGDIGVVA